MRIDHHQHFWIYRAETHAWIDESMRVLRRDFFPPEFEIELRRQGIDGSIAVQAAQTMEETRWLLELARRHDFIRGVVGWVDLQAEDVADSLAELARNPRLVGIRHIVQSEPDPHFLLRPAFLRGIKELERWNLDYDLLIYAHQFEPAIELVRRFPNQRFVLDHLGKPKIRERALIPWSAHLRELACCPNVVAKLSGLVTEASWSDWTEADLRPFIDTAVDAFTPKRLMAGSDWPVCLLAGSYERVMSVVRDIPAEARYQRNG